MGFALPDPKDAFLFENGFYLTCSPRRIGKFIAHYELFRKAGGLTGIIVECGVFKGASLMRWAKFRELFSGSSKQKIVAFDIFGVFPEGQSQKDQDFRVKFTSSAGDQSISTSDLLSALRWHQLEKNIELIPGDILVTVPHYIDENPRTSISMLVVDVDFYEPTYAALENLYPLVTKGGVVVLDDYGAVEGATKAVEDFFGDQMPNIQRFPYSPTPAYFIKE